MKKTLYMAIALGAASCSAKNDLQETFENVVGAGTNMVLDILQSMADEELQRPAGVASLATSIHSADTVDVERAVRRELLKQLSE